MLPYTASCDIESVIYTCLELVTRLLRCENPHSSVDTTDQVDTLRPFARLSLLSHLSSLALHSARWNVPHPLAMRGGPSLVTVQGWLENGITRYNITHIMLITLFSLMFQARRSCEIYYGRRVDDQASFHGVADI
uniref:Uncharacterized protein n=1 Tax=Timema genevievae TaxID=629358 RepID=A0A7R9PIX4_TIMGE|nr:unnamed protein product [Timema genevievae]